MGAVRDNNFFVVHGWMINQLGLKGSELELYAIIYGFSQAEGQQFHGSLQYLADWTNIAKRNVLARLQSLVEKGLLVKTDVYINGVKTCEYRCVLNPAGVDETSPGVVMKHHQGGDETSSGVVMKHHRGGDETSPNNISHNIPDNIPDKKDIGGQAPTAPTKAKRFIPPTVEEVAAYCRERGNHVDAQRWFDYYTANGWKVGRNPMKDWKACVRTWERQGAQGGGRVQQPPERSRIKTEADYAAGMEGWG